VLQRLIKKGKNFDVGCERDSTKRHPKVENPERVIESSFNRINAGFWYIAVFRHDAVVAMDQDEVIKVIKVINGGDNGRVDRTAFTNRIRRILL
jgi:predicted chitinase